MKRITCLVFFVFAMFAVAVFAQYGAEAVKPAQSSKTEKPSAAKTADDSPAEKTEKEAKQLAPSVIMENTYLYVYINLKQVDTDAIFDTFEKISKRFIDKAKEKSPKTFKSTTLDNEIETALATGRGQLTTWIETFEKESISEIIILQSLEYQTQTPYLVVFPTTQEPSKKFNLKLAGGGDTMFPPLKSIGKFKGCYCYVPATSQAATANMDAAAIFKLGKIRNSPAVINDALELQKRSPIRIIFAPSSGLKSLATLAVPALIAQIPEETEVELEIDKKALTKDVNYLITNTQSISVGITPQDPRITFAVQTPTEKAATTMHATLEKLLAMQAAFIEKTQAKIGGMPNVAKLGGNNIGNNMMAPPMTTDDGMTPPTGGDMPQMMNGGMMPVMSVASLPAKHNLPVVKGKRLVAVFDNRTIDQFEDGIVDAFIEGYKFGKQAAGAVDEDEEDLQCADNMKKIMLAMHALHDKSGSLPRNFVDTDGKPFHSWRLWVLPALGHKELANKINIEEPWDSEYNKQFHNEIIPEFACIDNPDAQEGKNCCYVVITDGLFTPVRTDGDDDKSQRPISNATDGASNTLALIEVKTPFCWMDPTADITLADLEKGINKEGSRIGSHHKGGVYAAFFDGVVRFIPDTIDIATLKAFATCDGGEDVTEAINNLPTEPSSDDETEVPATAKSEDETVIPQATGSEYEQKLVASQGLEKYATWETIDGQKRLVRINAVKAELTGKLNLSGCTALSFLNCSLNQLTSLDVSKCTALKVISCGNNQLTSLDITQCTALSSLTCGSNQLTSLDVTQCTALKALSCSNNQLTSLDTTQCTALMFLHCGSNQLGSLDVTQCTALTSLSCSGNEFTSLDVSQCKKLDVLKYDKDKVKLKRE